MTKQIKRRIVTEFVDDRPDARRRTARSMADKGEVLAQEARALLGHRRRAFTRSQADAPAMPGYPARQAATRSRGWFSPEEIQAACDHATGNARWKAGRAEHGEAVSMLLSAGVARHRVYALAANRRLTRRQAQDIINGLPNWPKEATVTISAPAT